MIDVEVKPNGVKLTGHAGYAPQGLDIVCAGVSALFIGLLKSIQELTDDEPAHIIAPGNSMLEIKNPSSSAMLLIDSFFVGITEMADYYPDYVKVSRRE
jgi:uncharacterized protein YsxB (DUF464 family)